MKRIKYRKLYKMAVEIKSEQINEENRGLFLEMCEKDGRRKMESKISGMVGVDPKEVISSENVAPFGIPEPKPALASLRRAEGPYPYSPVDGKIRKIKRIKGIK